MLFKDLFHLFTNLFFEIQLHKTIGRTPLTSNYFLSWGGKPSVTGIGVDSFKNIGQHE
jgi:hypothetical protein